MRDFTLQQYARLVDLLHAKIGPFCTVADWHQHQPKRGVLVRHDVDRKPKNALAMAILEAERGMYTTYYFRVVGSAWNEEIIRKVAALGHEVGYHYEDLSLAKGDVERAHESFAKHLRQIRNIAPVRTVTMHGSPLSRHNNLDMWKLGHPKDYDLDADAFMDVDYAGMPYFTDTGRRWDGRGANLRDKPASAAEPPNVKSSEDLMQYIAQAKPTRLAFSAHPERWAVGELDWTVQLLKDTAINSAKRLLRVLR